MKRKRIIIVGGGFAGIELIKRLAGNKYYEIMLIDINNYYFFPPLLYQVAAGFLDTASISYPFRRMIRNKKNIHFRMGKLIGVDPKNKICFLEDGELSYDYLVIGTGAEPNYFGMENIRRHAIPMKNIRNALQMRNTILENLEKATMLGDTIERKKLLSIVVAGGGPTGVEVSGMLAELRKYIFKKDYPELGCKLPLSSASPVRVDK